MSEQLTVHKVTLSSGKVVHLKEMKIKFQNLALQAVGSKAKDNQVLLANLAQQELLKILLVDIDGKTVDPKSRENLDNLFSYSEFVQLMKVVGDISGVDDAGELQTEIVVTGSN